MQSDRLPKVFAAMALAGVAFGLTVACFEILARATGLQPAFLYQLDEEVCATHIPGLEATLVEPEFRTRVSFNSAGYRDVERRHFRTPGTLRVLFLGDSFIEALQVPFEETAAQVLERELGELMKRKVEVLNLGNAGFGTACAYLTLHHRGLAYDPHVVVLGIYVGNDIYDNHPRLAVEPYQPYYEVAADGRLVLRPLVVRDSAIKRWLRAYSRTYLFVRDRVKKLVALHRLGARLGLIQGPVIPSTGPAALDRRTHAIYRISRSPLIEQAWEVTDALLGRVADEVSQAGATFVVLIIPTGEQFDDRSALRYAQTNSGGDRDDLDFELPTRRLRSMLELRSIPYVDLLPVFRASDLPASELYFPGNGHWTSLGNRMAGEALLRELDRRLAAHPAAG